MGLRLRRSVRMIARLSAAGALVLPVAGAVTALVTQSPVAASTYQSSALYTPAANNVAQFFTVPPAVTQIAIDAKGGQGGDGGSSAGVSGGSGGKAAEVIDLVPVSPGDTLIIAAGRAGGSGAAGTAGTNGNLTDAGGAGGGGAGTPAGNGGGGGAATRVGAFQGAILLVAGGGGGGGGGGGIVGYSGGAGGVAGDPPGGGTGGSGPGAGSGAGTKSCASGTRTGDSGGNADNWTLAGAGGGGGGGFGGTNTGLCGGAGGGAGGLGAGGGGGGGAGASYVNDSNSFASNILTSSTGGDGSVLITWGQPTSRTSVSSTGATTVGGARTFTATVSPSFPITTPAPTGTVNFYEGTRLLGSRSLDGGTATFTTADLVGGSNTVRAAYQGDAVYASSQSFNTFSMGLGTPRVQASTSPDPTTGSAHFLAAVSTPDGSAATAPVPTGTVQFVDTTDGHRIDSGTYTLDGNGQLDVPSQFSNDAHLYTFDAIYSGDANYSSATTSFSVHVVDASFTSIDSGLNPAKVGQHVPLTAYVNDITGSTTPTGTVTFYDNGAVLGTATLAGGRATLSPTLSSGTHWIAAQYSGDSVHLGSPSDALEQVIEAAQAPVADAGSPSRARKGATVTVDGTRSTDPQGEPLTYQWEEISGLPATIADKGSARTSVILPKTAGTVKLRLTVTNAAGLSSTSDVTITVSPK
ncbi:MAG: Ig-like domain repeat protein [Acidimicrobiia bacterium]|nr:Ig-like domain repeat protein [Acidimicrobiia bacterium]